MKSNMFYLILVLVLTITVCAAFVMVNAHAKNEKPKGPDEQGHALTSLWKNYYSAQKADLPKQMSEALDAIMEQAKAKRYHWDFYDAAVKKVDAEVSRNWKVRQEMNTFLANAIKEYDEPIVTYAYRSSYGGSGLLDFVLANKTRLQAGKNKAFHTRTAGHMNGLLNGFIKDDYEYALWSERLSNRNTSKGFEALKEYLGETYPNAAWNEYVSLQGRYWAYREDDVKAFIDKYSGKAISLFGKALKFEDRMSYLSRNKGTEADYKALYADIKAAEKERLSFRSGVDSKIAGTIESFKNQIETLEEKDVSILFEGDDIVVTLRNLPSVEVSMYLDNKEGTPLFKKTVNNPRKSFYVLDTVKVPIPRCDDGNYIVKAKNGKVETMGQYIPKTLSIALREDFDGRKFYVAEYLTGKPLDKVDLALILSGKVVAEAKDVKVDGFTPLPENLGKVMKKDTYYYLRACWKDPDGFLHFSKEQSIRDSRDYYSERKGRVSDYCEIFTDKTAFNPGETVKYKAVLYSGNQYVSFKVFDAGEAVEVSFINADDKEIAKTELKTNDFGSVAGEFKIPEGEKNGQYTIRVRHKKSTLETKSIVVDEFVLPTYDLAFDSIDKLYFMGDEIEVKGKVSSYSGHPLDAAEVNYEVDCWGNIVADGEVKLESDGSFSVKFPSVKDRYWYRVTVKVMDATGETSEFSRRVFVLDAFNIEMALVNAAVGDISLGKDKYGQCELLSENVAKVTFTSRNNEGQPVPVGIKYELKDSNDKVVAGGEAESGSTKEITIPAPGLYTLVATSSVKATNGKEISSKSEMKILVVSDGDMALNADVENFFKLVGPCSDCSVKDGGEIKVQFGAGAGPVWAVAELFDENRKPLGRELVHLDGKPGSEGSVKTLSFEYKSEYPDALTLYIFYFRNGTHYVFHREFQREKTILDLPLTFSSFEDKAYPGKQYSFTLKSDPGTEMVAAIFDKASESISPNQWETVRLVNLGARPVYYDVMDGSIDRGRIFDYDDRMMMKTRAAGAKNSAMVLEAAPMMEDQVMVEESYLSAEDASAADLDEVSVRSDFSTALAFEPYLKTDSNGSATLKFKTSDKLSTFIVQVFAHTKEMKNALLRQEMTVSIPVKVNVVEPKYIYKGDKYVLHATVSSSTDKPVSGTVALQTYSGLDIEGAKPFATVSKKVTVPARKTVPVEFTVDPKGHDMLGLKVVFADNAKSFSDAVLVPLPVYEAEQTLTESHSAVLLAGMDKNALIQRIRSAFTGTTSAGAEYKEIDIRQMVLDAIPSKVEPAGKDILSLTEAYYVRRVAEKLGADFKFTTSDEDILDKIVACQNADGGFGWFEGMKSSPVITAVVLERFAKLRDAGLAEEVADSQKAVAFLDKNQFVHSDWPYWSGWLSTAQYAHVRSMYSSVKFDVSKETISEASEYSKNFKEFKKYIKDYLIPSQKDGRGLQGQILAKARRIKTLVNLVYGEGGLKLASDWGIKMSADQKMRSSIVADIASLDEYAVEHRDGGWYYPNAVMPWRGLLESELYAHSLLCDLLSDTRVSRSLSGAEGSGVEGSGAEGGALSGAEGQEAKIADGIRIWMMLQKETQKWGEDPAFVDAINSVLTGGEDVLSTRVILMTKTYRKPFKEIVAAGNGFTIERHFYKEVQGENSTVNLLEIYPGMKLSRGEKIITEYKIWNQENRSFVKLNAPREAAFRPVDQLSGHVGWWYRPIGSWAVSPQGYRNVKADRTEYYFDVYPEENTTVTEEFYITQKGIFSAPVVTIESLYAPHYRANDKFGGTVNVLE